jgi:hypothetical protein
VVPLPSARCEFRRRRRPLGRTCGDWRRLALVYRFTRRPESRGPLRQGGIALRLPVRASIVVLRRLDNDGRLLLGRQRLRQPIEAVALAGHGDDKARLLGIGLDLFPEPSHEHVDAAVERLETPVRERVQQSVAADNPTWSGDEHPQYSELASCKRHRFARVAGQQASVKVEEEPGEAHDRFGFPRRLYAVKSRSVAHERSSVRGSNYYTPPRALYKTFTGRTSSVYATSQSGMGSRPWTAIVAAQLEKEEGP